MYIDDDKKSTHRTKFNEIFYIRKLVCVTIYTVQYINLNFITFFDVNYKIN